MLLRIETVAVGQVVSAEQAGLATTEQLTEATQDLATSDDIQMLADLIGKPVNEVTEEDLALADGIYRRLKMNKQWRMLKRYGMMLREMAN